MSGYGLSLSTVRDILLSCVPHRIMSYIQGRLGATILRVDSMCKRAVRLSIGGKRVARGELRILNEFGLQIAWAAWTTESQADESIDALIKDLAQRHNVFVKLVVSDDPPRYRFLVRALNPYAPSLKDLYHVMKRRQECTGDRAISIP